MDRPALRTAALLSLLAAPAVATSYVAIADGALADQAAVIAEVRVEAVAPSAGAAHRPATDYRVAVLRPVKGEAAGSLVVREPGGEGEDGLRLEISGVPVLRAGDRALLFLVEHEDGTYGILHLLLGAFSTASIAEIDGRRVAWRDLGAATEMRPGGAPAAPGEDRPRDLERFAAWLADRAGGRERPADYFVDLPAGGRRSLREKFTFIPDRNGRHIRWFDFDNGAGVAFHAHANGQPGLPGGGYEEFQRALAAWNDESQTPVNYVYAGTTTQNGGLKTFDSTNTILFDDPNKEIDGVFDCAAGGILAVSSPWIRSTVTELFQNEVFSQIVGADIITNDGIACYLTRTGNPSKAAEEVFGHELGHTLGLAHSCGDPASPPCAVDAVKNDALMRAFAHGDGRGARLGADDLAGIRYLYDPAPRSIVACRPTSTVLCLNGRRFKAELFWHNQFDRSAGLGLAVPSTDSTGYFSFGDPQNLELLVKVLNFGGGTFKVFYGELTNLKFTLTLTDTLTGVIKTYGNTTGDCGGIDQSYYGSAASPDLAILAPRRGSSGACRADRDTLCLLNGRFAVRVHWQNPFDGTSGEGGAAPLSNLVGTFYFTDRNNVELMTKILQFPDRLAFFYGALSDLAYTIEVTDTASGVVKTYQSTPARLCGGLDNSAF